MKDEITRSWKDNAITISMAGRGVEAILMLKQELGMSIPKKQKNLINHAIDDIVHAIWRLTTREKKYKEFKKEYLEVMEVKMKEELES